MLRSPLKSESTWKIPATFSPLIGREQEVAEVCALLQRQDVRLLTLLGTGGIGKTRLSIQVATILQEHFTDGVCFVPLAPISDPNLVIPAIAQELGIQEFGGVQLFEQVKWALQDRHALLVLDNFEQVVGAAPLLVELLVTCSALKILVTSRAVLRIQGEHEYSIPPLAVPDLEHLSDVEVLSHNAAVALFTQRAQATKPDFQLTQPNARAIAEICARLDGLPLAIELAAARIKLLPPQALLARLKHQLSVLTSGARDLPVRQQTLENTIAWSYDLLDAQEQRLFRQLSVFVGGCTLAAAEAVAIGTDAAILPVLDGVASLLDKSLLLSVGQEEEEPRIRMLQTIREFGLERLHEHGEAEVCQRAHALYYLTFIEQAEPQLKGGQQTIWLVRVEHEQENLRTALTWLVEQKETELAMRLCAALGWFWYLRGHWSEGRRWLATTLSLPQTEKPTVVRANVLKHAGNLALYQNDYASARSLLDECVALCRTLIMQSELANALTILGWLLHLQGEDEIARPVLEESEVLCRRPGSTWELTYLLRQRGVIAWDQGDLAQAAACAQEGLTLARRLGDKFLIARTLSILCSVATRRGDLAQATTLAREALTFAREVGHKSMIATTLQNLGYLLALQGDLEQGVVLTQEGLTLFRDLGDKLYITVALQSLGFTLSLQGNVTQAAAAFQEGLALSEEIGNQARVGLHLMGLARVAAAEGHYQRAARLLGAAETRYNIDVNLNSFERAEYERLVQRIRTQLGDHLFAASSAEGRAMTPQQALAAPEQVLPPKVSKPSSSTYPDGLTAREVAILRLVAQGMSDAQVAEKLVISPRTVNWHLTSIYSKIQVTSRSAATRYAVEHHLI
jgi:predicted ATPase/DNA-binding CsgD family transcriptional regulator